jgi:tetratricopeptide (TPR) repeat protein
MDCRKSCWVGLALMTAALGCATRNSQTTTASGTNLMPNSPSGMPSPIEITKEKDLPKKPPSPGVLIAYGNLQAQEAADPERTPQGREQLLDQARRCYQQALELDPENLDALKALAHLYVSIKDHDRAIATYQHALKANAKDATIWFEMGMYQMQCKEWAPATENMRQAVTLDPENRHYVKTLGFALARAGRFDESVACLEQAVGPAEARYDVARMQLHLQQDEPAKQNLRLALQSDPKHREARMLLAQLEAPPASPGDASLPKPAPISRGVTVGFEE